MWSLGHRLPPILCLGLLTACLSTEDSQPVADAEVAPSAFVVGDALLLPDGYQGADPSYYDTRSLPAVLRNSMRDQIASRPRLLLERVALLGKPSGDRALALGHVRLAGDHRFGRLQRDQRLRLQNELFFSHSYPPLRQPHPEFVRYLVEISDKPVSFLRCTVGDYVVISSLTLGQTNEMLVAMAIGNQAEQDVLQRELETLLRAAFRPSAGAALAQR